MNTCSEFENTRNCSAPTSEWNLIAQYSRPRLLLDQVLSSKTQKASKLSCKSSVDPMLQEATRKSLGKGQGGGGGNEDNET